VQRFGSALNLNVHFHTLVLDGVYPITEAGPSRFHPLPPPDDGEVARVVTATARRLVQLLEKRGLGPNADPMEADPLAQEEPLLAALAAASLEGRVATGPRAGQRLLRLGDRVEPDDREYLEAEPPRRCASAGGLSLHADVAVPARDRRRLERLCRYVARPPLATERLTQLDDGRLCYRLKRRWRDGTTHLLLERVALLERLAALVPPPRFHLVRYHGILAPCASWRDHVIPAGAGPLIPQTSRTARTKEGPADTKPGGDGARSGPSLRGDPGTTAASGGVIPTNPECRATADVPTPAEGARSPRLRRLPWSDLLQRVFAVDALACPRCGERLRLLAAIESPEAIRAIMDCLGLPSRAPPLAPSEPEATSLEFGFEELPTFEA
jgi:hypothetical protein